MSTQFSSIWPIDRTLSGAITPGKSEPGSDGKEEVLCIPQSSRITGTSPLDCLVSYPGDSLGGEVLPLCRDAVSVFYSPIRMGNMTLDAGRSYLSVEMQSVYSTSPLPTDWAIYRVLIIE